MTVAVCLVVALRTIDLRCADMTEKLKPARKWRDACSLDARTTDRQASSAYYYHGAASPPLDYLSLNLISRPDSNGK
jgi:hypothetical protein